MSRRRSRSSRGPLVAVLALGLLLGWMLGWAWRDLRGAPAAAGRNGSRQTSRQAPRQAAPSLPVVPSDAVRDSGPARARQEPRSVPGRPAPGPGAAVAPLSGTPGRVALVIDDLGRRPEDLETLASFGVPVAHAVLPYETHSSEVAAAARARGAELLLHLPMESAQAGENPGPGALFAAMSDGELAEATRRALAAVPGAAGINNHMGSALSTDRRAMRAVLAVAAERGLFFLDSRTTPASVGFAVARELDVPALDRQVFLDDDLAPEAIRVQFARWLSLAAERGEAIAIGHPHPSTLAVLAEEIPRARQAGVRFVRLRDLLAPGER